MRYRLGSYEGPQLSLEVTRCVSPLAAEVSVGGERDVTLRLELWPLGLWASVSRVVPKWLRDRWPRDEKHRMHLWYGHGRRTGFNFNGCGGWLDGFFSLSVWADEMGNWSRDAWKSWPWGTDAGWSFSLHPLRWLVGTTTYEAVHVETVEGLAVPMPEGWYPAKVTIERVRWNRWYRNGRWHYRATCEVPGGIPIPGKGENSYDCEDDATHSCTFAIEAREPDVADVLIRFASDALRTRAHRGGIRWLPAERVAG